MRRSGIILCISLLLVSQASIAQNEHSIFGPGAASCDAMLSKVAEAPVAQMLFVAWVQGYLSGLNMVRLGQGQSAVHLEDASSLFPSIASHCRQKPGDSVTDAASSLYTSLLADQSAAAQTAAGDAEQE